MAKRWKRKKAYRKTEEPKFKIKPRCAIFVATTDGEAKSVGDIKESTPAAAKDKHAERLWLNDKANQKKLAKVLIAAGNKVAQVEVDLAPDPCSECTTKLYPELRKHVDAAYNGEGSCKIFIFLGREKFKKCIEVDANGKLKKKADNEQAK